MRSALLFVGLASLCFACTTVQGDRVLGSDLARADARFTTVPANYVAGFAPMPGVQRVFDAGELARLARIHGVDSDGLRSLCFERLTTVLSDSRVLAALKAAVPSDIRIELIDYSKQSVPEGELEFSRADLPKPKDTTGTVTWNGKVRYGSGHSSPAWATVRVLKEETWVEAVSAVPASATIRLQSLIVKTGWRSPLPASAVRDPEAIAGQVAMRAIAAGEPILSGMIKAPREVRAGDPVEIEVGSGSVRLRFSGIAVTGGRANDTVVVSAGEGRKLKARVVGKDRVYVDAQNFGGSRGASGPTAFGEVKETTSSAVVTARPLSR